MLSVSDCDESSRRVSMSSGGDQTPPEPSSRRSSRVLKNDLMLHEAVIKNEPECVREVLKEIVDVNCRNNYGRAPIHWASSRGNTEIMEMLIEARCDIEARDKYGMRPLLMAAWHGHKEAVKLLVKHGASVNAVNKKRYGVLMCASKNNRLDVLEELLELLDRVDLEITDTEDNTCLHHAAAAGHVAVVARLLALGARVNAANKAGRTCLHLACEKGQEQVVSLLLEKNAQLDLKDLEGNTPLHITVENKHTTLVQQLLEAGNPLDVENNLSMTPLHLACSLGCHGILESLIQNGSDIDRQMKDGNTALHLACTTNDLEIVEHLIAKGADINCLNEKLQSPMHIAAENGYTDICQVLLAAGANIEQKEQSGRTPLYIAARGSFTAIVDMIIKTARLEYLESIYLERKKSTLALEAGSGCCEKLREILKKLAYKQLGPEHWKQLAARWAFTPEQIRAIEHQYTGPLSYKEHAYRMMVIWAEGLGPDANPTQELYQALVAINLNRVAESVRRRFSENNELSKREKLCPSSCCIV